VVSCLLTVRIVDAGVFDWFSTTAVCPDIADLRGEIFSDYQEQKMSFWEILKTERKLRDEILEAHAVFIRESNQQNSDNHKEVIQMLTMIVTLIREIKAAFNLLFGNFGIPAYEWSRCVLLQMTICSSVVKLFTKDPLRLSVGAWWSMQMFCSTACYYVLYWINDSYSTITSAGFWNAACWVVSCQIFILTTLVSIAAWFYCRVSTVSISASTIVTPSDKKADTTTTSTTTVNDSWIQKPESPVVLLGTEQRRTPIAQRLNYGIIRK